MLLAAAMTAVGIGAAAAATDPEVAALARGTLNQMAAAPADKEAVMDAINRATAGAELDVIASALCQLQQKRDIDEIVGAESAALLSAQSTLNRDEVEEALGDACEVAQLALASYGATGGVPAGSAPGQAFGSGGFGAPGGGGGSGYTN
jgi:hypothetical protein